MKDQRELVSELVGIARIAHDTEQLRDRIAYALAGVFSALSEATTRAERAEAELKAAREQEPYAYEYARSNGDGTWSMHMDKGSLVQTGPASWRYGPPTDPHPERPVIRLYRDPIPAPAGQVPQEWRDVMAELAADLQAACEAEHPHRQQYPSVMRKYQNDMMVVERARALLQQSEVKS